VPSGDVEHRAIGQLPASGDDDLQIGASGFVDSIRPALRSRKKSLADMVRFFASASVGVEAIALM
jgi:hypothetical protein